VFFDAAAKYDCTKSKLKTLGLDERGPWVGFPTKFTPTLRWCHINPSFGLRAEFSRTITCSTNHRIFFFKDKHATSLAVLLCFWNFVKFPGVGIGWIDKSFGQNLMSYRNQAEGRAKNNSRFWQLWMFSGTRIGLYMTDGGLPDPRSPGSGVEGCFNIVCILPNGYGLWTGVSKALKDMDHCKNTKFTD
jgi:hypothetical protein